MITKVGLPQSGIFLYFLWTDSVSFLLKKIRRLRYFCLSQSWDLPIVKWGLASFANLSEYYNKYLPMALHLQAVGFLAMFTFTAEQVIQYTYTYLSTWVRFPKIPMWNLKLEVRVRDSNPRPHHAKHQRSEPKGYHCAHHLLSPPK